MPQTNPDRVRGRVIERPMNQPLVAQFVGERRRAGSIGRPYAGEMRTVPAVALLVVLWLLVPGDAFAKRLTDLDARTGVQFVLDGRTLTTTITPGPHPVDVRSELYGNRIVAVCGCYGPLTRVVREATWPANVNQLSFVFDRDMSEAVSWCILETETGGDIAEAAFGPIPGLFYAKTDYKGSTRPRGVRRYLRVRDAKRRIVTTRRGGRLPVRALRPGRYTLITFERRCRRGCRTLGPVRARCARRFRIRAGRSLAALVVADQWRQRCRISFTTGD